MKKVKKKTSVELSDQIVEEIMKYNKLKEEADEMSPTLPWDEPNVHYNKVKDEMDRIDANIFFIIGSLYESSLNDNYYFFDCPYKVYLNTFTSRKERFLKMYIDGDELDFLKVEIENLYSNSKRTIDIYDYSRFFVSGKQYEFSLEKKRKYVAGLLNDLGYKVTVGEDDYVQVGYEDYEWQSQPPIVEKIKHIESEEENIIHSKLSINQTVLLLQEIGFFSHPKIEDASKVKQAELISRMIGANEKNIKSKIELLDKNSKTTSANYNKDIDKINQILDELIK